MYWVRAATPRSKALTGGVDGFAGPSGTGANGTTPMASRRSRLAAAADYHRLHGHLAAPATTPVGAWLAEQRHLAKHRSGQLPDECVRLIAALFDGDWTAENAASAVLA